VVGINIDEVRRMKLIDIEMDKKLRKAYVDLITGSLYDYITGICFSSPNLHIAKARE
jgi:hypothetical protein